MTKIAILGAGLAGLSTSYFLRRAGVPHRLLERDARPGGHATTTDEAGYRFDRTGHLLHLRDPDLLALVTEWLGPGRMLEIDRKSVVLSHGTTTRYPFQANVHGLPAEVAYACVRDFVNARLESEPREIRTFEDFCLRHFGAAISHAFMIPYNEKLWGVHPREITASWCDRFVPLPSVDDVLRGAFGVAPPELGYNTRFRYPRLGIGELANALSQRAGPVETGCVPTTIDLEARRIELSTGETMEYQALVSTLPLDAFLRTCTSLPEAVRSAGRALRSTHLHYLDLALNTPSEVGWHWAYVPEARFCFYRVGVYSNLSPSMAPTGKASLYVELATRETPELSVILPRVAAELTELGVIRAPEAIRFARLRRLDPAYVVFDAARAPALEVIEPYLRDRGVLFAGRYGKWTYASMEEALSDGRAAAAEAADQVFGGARA